MDWYVGVFIGAQLVLDVFLLRAVFSCRERI